jgi:hypothetical protein
VEAAVRCTNTITITIIIIRVRKIGTGSRKNKARQTDWHANASDIRN